MIDRGNAGPEIGGNKRLERMMNNTAIEREFVNGPQILDRVSGVDHHVLAYRVAPDGRRIWTADDGTTWTDSESVARAQFASRMPQTLDEACRMIDAECERLGVQMQVEASRRVIHYALQCEDYDTPMHSLGTLSQATRFISALKTIAPSESAEDDLVGILNALPGTKEQPNLLPGEHIAPDGSVCSCTADDRRYGCGCR